jgi:hypothetical protein
MGEFSRRTRERAAEILLEIHRQEATRGEDPLVELVATLLDENGTGFPLSDAMVSTEQWQMWNQVAMDCQEELSEMLTSVLDMERLRLPMDLEAMQLWASCLVQRVLDRMGMG